ncbi:extracellular solute-binding protein [Sessilibacter corallicola]|uniref:extracellular solute-binding protein n=1 Tax=Sessilibacter corallicola TaxID=2904075 RepID=UPI001E61267C|nr:extracellular solute-binding protein [Sessilibacter corallicola]MCE2028588.1 extracellular solute-binding protein [Sessilibacter corallicola]
MRMLGLLAVIVASISSQIVSAQEESKTLRVYNWSGYIGDGVIEAFEKETGVDVIYDTYDSSSEVEEKILRGGNKYDVVVSSLNFMAAQSKQGLFQPIDRQKIRNYDGLDPDFMSSVSTLDIENTHGIPYMWGTLGIGYNETMVRGVLGSKAPIDSWDLIFKPENLKKLSACGVSFLEESTQMTSLVLNYLKKDPNSSNVSDYKKSAESYLKKLAQHVNVFDSKEFLDNLSSGKICVAVGWSGDIAKAIKDAKAENSNLKLRYVLPKEGTFRWVDMLSIPVLSENTDIAHAFIDFLTRPEIAAKNTNNNRYANPVPKSLPFVEPLLRDDRSIFPTKDVQLKLFQNSPRSILVRRAIKDVWKNVLDEYQKFHPVPFNPNFLKHNTQDSEKIWDEAADNLLQG